MTMAIKITVDLLEAYLPRELAAVTLIHIDTSSDSAPDFAILATETDNPLTGTPAWEKQGLLTQQGRQRSVWRLVEAAARWAAEEAEKP